MSNQCVIIAMPMHRKLRPEDTPIGGNASAIEGGNQFLAAHGWKTKRQDHIVGHGGCGSMRWRRQDGFDTQSLNAASILRDTRQRIPAMPRIRRARPIKVGAVIL